MKYIQSHLETIVKFTFHRNNKKVNFSWKDTFTIHNILYSFFSQLLNLCLFFCQVQYQGRASGLCCHNQVCLSGGVILQSRGQCILRGNVQRFMKNKIANISGKSKWQNLGRSLKSRWSCQSRFVRVAKYQSQSLQCIWTNYWIF